MKASHLSKRAGACLGLFISALLSASAQAGSGPQYWQAAGMPKAQNVAQGKLIATTTGYCAGAEVVVITSTKTSWPNARGPLVPVQTETRRICHVCSITSVVTTHDWPSHRGPLTKTETTKVGVVHDCGSGCVMVAKN